MSELYLFTVDSTIYHFGIAIDFSFDTRRSWVFHSSEATPFGDNTPLATYPISHFPYPISHISFFILAAHFTQT